MNYATQQTSRSSRVAISVLSVAITLTLSASIIFGMAGGLDSSTQAPLAVKQAPQLVAGR
jgi:hypothetical protein